MLSLWVLLRKVNMLTYYLTEFVWTCFIKYVALNIVCMTYCLLYSASAMTCVIELIRLYYPNITVIYIRNLLLIIVCSSICNHWYVNHWCMHVCCVYFNKLNWTKIVRLSLDWSKNQLKENVPLDVSRDGVVLGVGFGCEGNGKKQLQKTCFSAGHLAHVHYFNYIRQRALGACILLLQVMHTLIFTR